MARVTLVGVLVLAVALAGCSGSASSTKRAVDEASLRLVYSPSVGGSAAQPGDGKPARVRVLVCTNAHATPLCSAAIYFIAHRPKHPCLLSTLMPGTPARLTIAGSFRGHPVRVAVGPLCNPPTPLIRAKATLYAAFEQA